MEQFRDILRGTVKKIQIDQIVEQVNHSPARFDELYALTKEEQPIARHATWACEKLSIQQPSLYINKVEELMECARQCTDDGTRRLLLNILLRMPPESLVQAAFLDFCLHKMRSRSETTGVQAVCMKLAYAICQSERDLLNELKICLEEMEPAYYTPAVQSARRQILKKMRKKEK